MERTNYKITIILMLFFPSFFLSCEEEEAPETEVPDQLFRPVSFNAGIDGNTVSFSWVPIANASYSLEISRDSLVFEKELQVIPVDGTVNAVVDNLWSDARYSARIKSISKKAEIKDSEYNAITFKTGTENIFYAVADGDIGANHVVLSWDATRSVSHIMIADVTSVSLTDGEKQAGIKDLTGLTPGTSYTFKIYNGEMLRGTITVVTSAS